ncbi:MAG: hypothetical protein HYY24_02525 [Verrucomicrobia bacterium]|nr:hypothetical protein [Verrucomicrobiota bacterium]
MNAGGQLIASDNGIVLAADVFDLEELRRLIQAFVEFSEAVGVKVGFTLAPWNALCRGSPSKVGRPSTGRGLKITGSQQW